MWIYVVSTVALAVAWVLISGQISAGSVLIGLAAGLGITLLGRPRQTRLQAHRIPDQVFGLLIYLLVLYREILLSGVDTARRVLSRDMGLKMGIIAISTQDEQRSRAILAMSANTITLPPGELVVEVADDHLLYVHCLNVDQSLPHLETRQARRLHLLKRILGREQ